MVRAVGSLLPRPCRSHLGWARCSNLRRNRSRVETCGKWEGLHLRLRALEIGAIATYEFGYYYGTCWNQPARPRPWVGQACQAHMPIELHTFSAIAVAPAKQALAACRCRASACSSRRARSCRDRAVGTWARRNNLHRNWRHADTCGKARLDWRLLGIGNWSPSLSISLAG